MAIGPHQFGGYIYPSYPPKYQAPKTITKVTETMEYDEAGNLVKKTVVTETTTEQPVDPTTFIWNNSQIDAGTISAGTIKKPKPVPKTVW